MKITKAEARVVKQLVDEQLQTDATLLEYPTVAALLETAEQRDLAYYKMLGSLSSRLDFEAVNSDNEDE